MFKTELYTKKMKTEETSSICSWETGAWLIVYIWSEIISMRKKVFVSEVVELNLKHMKAISLCNKRWQALFFYLYSIYSWTTPFFGWIVFLLPKSIEFLNLSCHSTRDSESKKKKQTTVWSARNRGNNNKTENQRVYLHWYSLWVK